MLSNKMQTAINNQINAELWSAYLYLAMSLDAESKALKGLANWFFVQWLEEQDHARIFQEYLVAQGAKVVLQPIKEVPDKWDSPLTMFIETLRHERDVTRMIHNIAQLAYEEGDFATISRIQWFVDEQVEEEDSADQLVTDFSGATDYISIHTLDKELAEREYKKAEPLAK